MKWPLPCVALLLVMALSIVQSGCAFFGTGPEDSRIFVARYDTRFLGPDRGYPSDPHSLEAYAISDASDVSHPLIIGAGFDSRNELTVLVRSGEYYGEVTAFPFSARGNPYPGRPMDYDIGDLTLEINDAIVTGSGTLVAAGRTEDLIGPRDQIDFLIVSTATSGERIATFGRDGRVQTAFPALTTSGEIATCSIAYRAAVDPTGGFYVAGERNTDANCWSDGNPSAFAIAKYTDSGDLDSRFSSDGKEVSTISGTAAVGVSSIAADSDGNLILAGIATFRDGSRSHVIGRWLANGRLDRTFGSSGWRIVGPHFGSQSISAISLYHGFIFVMLDTGTGRSLRSDGTDNDRFGRPIAGTTRRTGSIRVTGIPQDLLTTDNAFYVLSQREDATYLTKHFPTGEQERERRVGVRSPLFPDSDFLGRELLFDGEWIYVVGIVQ